MLTFQHPNYELTPIHPSRRHYGFSLEESQSTPIISIVTPFYNTGEVFHQTAQSILQQSLQQFEWLIINDGSDDPHSLEILDHYRHLDPRIRVVDHSRNLGLSAARNTGFAEARCEYVLLLDSDDLLEPTAAEKWWWFLQTHPQFGFVASYHVAFEGKNYLWTGGFHDGAQNAERNRVSMMCMIRKSVHQKVGGFDETIRGGLEDWEFWMRCAAQGIWGATVPEFLAWYRVRAKHSDRWENLREERIKEFRAYLQQRYPRLYQGQFPNPPLQQIDLDLTQVTLEFQKVNLLRKNYRRLLLLLPWLVMGGAERFALNLMDQLQQRGWQITVVATARSGHPWLHEFARRSEDVFLLPNFLPIKDYPRFLGYLITSRQVDAVLLQGSLEGYRLLPVLRGLFPDLPILDYLHFVTPDWMQGGFPRLSLIYQKSLDASIASCKQVRRWMIEEGANPDKVKVAYIGVDPEIWKPDPNRRSEIRAQLGVGAEEVVILYAARLEAQKQPLLFIRILDELARRGVTFRAWIAGEGSLKRALEAILMKDQVLQERVQLLGEVKADQMPGLMAAADIFCLPSQNEGISQAIYEAMACGLPVVSAKVGGQIELLTPECGYLITPSPDERLTIEVYTDSLEKLIREPQLRLKMGANARERILAYFTLDRMGDSMVDIIEEIRSERKRKSFGRQQCEGKDDLVREAQLVVEYLQAREKYVELYKKYKKYAEWVKTHSASVWFYLWLRLSFLPIYSLLERTKFRRWLLGLKGYIKRMLGWFEIW